MILWTKMILQIINLFEKNFSISKTITYQQKKPKMQHKRF
jgi:hypothetical protein